MPSKNKDSTNEAILSRICNNLINQKINKKIKIHQKKIYKSTEQTIIEKEKRTKKSWIFFESKIKIINNKYLFGSNYINIRFF